MHRFLAIPAAAALGLTTTLGLLGLILQRAPDELLLDASLFGLLTLLLAFLPGFLHPELRAISATVIALPVTAPIAFLVIQGYEAGFTVGLGDTGIWLGFYAVYVMGAQAMCYLGAWARVTMSLRMTRRPAVTLGGYATRTWNPSF